MQTNSKAIEKAREEAREWEQNLDYYQYDFEIVDEPVSIRLSDISDVPLSNCHVRHINDDFHKYEYEDSS